MTACPRCSSARFVLPFPYAILPRPSGAPRPPAPRARQPQQMIFSFGGLAQRTLHEGEVIMSVARIFVAHERSFKVLLGDFILAASIKGETESDVRRCETRIALQSFAVSRARFTFFTLLVEG